MNRRDARAGGAVDVARVLARARDRLTVAPHRQPSDEAAVATHCEWCGAEYPLPAEE